MYTFLNIFFFVFHSSLVVFILVGWLWKKSRLINLVVICLTIFSWFFLGIWYGFGYCPCTDWHWQVRQHLGYYDMPGSYLVFLIQTFTGMKVNKTIVDIFAVIFLLLALIASIFSNIKIIHVALINKSRM